MSDKYFKFGTILLILFCLNVNAASYYGSGAYGDIGIGLRYDDNVSRAQLDTDREVDFINTFSGRYGYQKFIDQNSLLNISGQVLYERMNQFKSLNNIRFTVAGNYYYQTVTGFFKPWFELAVKISELRFNKSNIRDSQLLDTSARVGKRFTDKLTGIFSYQYEQRFSEEKVFDLVNHSLVTDLEYRFSRTGIFYLNYKARFGELVSTAIPNSRIISAAESVAPDDVFSPGFGPGCANRRCAYRLDATSHLLGAGLNLDLGENAEIDFATQYHNSNANGDNRYQGLIYHANIWYTF